MLDYEKVLENVGILLPRIRGGNLKQSMHGGLYDEEEEKGGFGINADIQTNRNSERMSEKIPFLEGGDISIS